jgi:glycosyltransferase involved in cell wall biosynthesis
MNFVYIARGITQLIGGAEISTMNLINGLRALGHNCTIVSTQEDVYALKMEKCLEFDAVLTQHMWSGMGRELADKINKPLIYFCHSWEHVCKAGSNPHVVSFCNQRCGTCSYRNGDFRPDLAIANSNTTYEIMTAQFKFDAVRIYPSIVFPKAPESTRDGPIVMSRVSLVKGILKTLEIAAAMPEEQFRIVGYSEFECPIPPNVLITGKGDPNEYLSNASVYLSPFMTETYGMGMVEAQYRGVPVVASHKCAVKDDQLVQFGYSVFDYKNTDHWIEMIKLAKEEISYIDSYREFFDKRHDPIENAKTLVKAINEI